jgi:hypothetical protein
MSQPPFSIATDREWQNTPRGSRNRQFIRTDLHADIYAALAYLKAHPNRIVKIRLPEGYKLASKRSVLYEYAARHEMPRLSSLFDPETRWLLFTTRPKKLLPMPLPQGVTAKRLFMTTTAAEWRDVRTTFDRRHSGARRSA